MSGVRSSTGGSSNRDARDPLCARGLTKRYGSTLAVDRLELSVRAGEVYGFLGPNGSGKTTTIRMVLGLHRPSEGTATIFGLDAWRDPVAAHRRVAYVAGEPSLWPQLSAEETLVFLGRMHGGVDAAYRETLVERFELEAAKKVRALSKGNRQKVQLIAAFATRAELLVQGDINALQTSDPGAIQTLNEDPSIQQIKDETGEEGFVGLDSHVPFHSHPHR